MKLSNHSAKQFEITTGAKKPAATSYGMCERYHTVDSLQPAPSRSLRDTLNARFWNFHQVREAGERFNERKMSK
jgi:hypothetical protein